MNNLVPGLIGLALTIGFLVIILVKVPAIPLIVIAVVVCVLIAYDLYLTLRE